jgi:hypothetical protein
MLGRKFQTEGRLMKARLKWRSKNKCILELETVILETRVQLLRIGFNAALL